MVKGLKSIASLKVDLHPINVLIGANGSGKSNFVGVFSFLHETREGRLQEYVRRAGGAEHLLHFGSKVTQEIEIQILFAQESNRYSLTLRPAENDSLYVAAEEGYSLNGDKWGSQVLDHPPHPRVGREASIGDPRAEEFGDEIRRLLGDWRIYHVHDTSASSPMRRTAQVNDNTFLRPDGANLAAFLYLLQEKHPDSYRLIRGTVQQVAPFFDDFLLRPDPLNEETIRLAWKHKNSDQYFGASALSDGSLRFIVLATLFLQPDKFLPSVIVVDEPELGLHPYAIALLSSLVKQASVKTQVILSTQSSLLLDHFETEDVLVAERSGGATQLRRLESSRLESWLEDYSLGQLWEKNELGGRPGQE
jgi:predicted ATPase